MKVMERMVQRVKRGKRQAYVEWEKKFAAIEKRLGGFPPKQYFQVIAGEDSATVVWERYWDTLAAAEDAYNKLWADPEVQQLTGKSILVAERREIYAPLDIE